MLRRAARVARFTLKNPRIAVRADLMRRTRAGLSAGTPMDGLGAQGRAEGRLAACSPLMRAAATTAAEDPLAQTLTDLDGSEHSFRAADRRCQADCATISPRMLGRSICAPDPGGTCRRTNRATFHSTISYRLRKQ